MVNEKLASADHHDKITVAFYEKKPKQPVQNYWFKKEESPDGLEHVCWERWVLNINCLTAKNQKGMSYLIFFILLYDF